MTTVHPNPQITNCPKCTAARVGGTYPNNVDAAFLCQSKIVDGELQRDLICMTVELVVQDLRDALKRIASMTDPKADYVIAQEALGEQEDITIDQAIKEGGTRCPYCQSGDIEADRFDYEISGMMVRCESCSREWQDNYSLTSIGIYSGAGEYVELGEST